jgi:ribosomal protein S18 acetylase RimI-like enzyme
MESDVLVSTMESLFVRTLAQADLEFAYELDVGERWNDTEDDLLRMYEYEPKGCFIAEVDQKPAGHVFSVIYGKLGWIGLLIVKPEYRRKRIATRLMHTVIDYLSQRGVQTIRLEAATGISELYRKLGFIDEYDSLRFSKTVEKPDQQMKGSSRQIKKEDIKGIAWFDKKYFGADRTRVLRRLFAENPRLCFAEFDGTSIDGYIMCRRAKSGYVIGPFVCNPENEETAEGLLQICMNRLGNTTVYVGVPATSKSAVDLLTRHGFMRYSRSIRMRFGQKIDEIVEGVFAIGGPMKG